MSARDLAKIAVVAGLGWVVWRYLEGDLDLRRTPVIGQDLDYLGKLARAESGGDMFAKAARSSASGLYQFTRATWEALGGDWGSDPAKAFGGLFPTKAEQDAMISRLTSQNAAVLRGAGIAASDWALYSIHFLGPGTGLRALTAAASKPMASIATAAQMAANPFLKTMTAGDYRAWLQRKMH